MKRLAILAMLLATPVAAQAPPDAALANVSVATPEVGCKYNPNSNRTPSGSGPAFTCSAMWGTTLNVSELVSQGVYVEIRQQYT